MPPFLTTASAKGSDLNSEDYLPPLNELHSGEDRLKQSISFYVYLADFHHHAAGFFSE